MAWASEKAALETEGANRYIVLEIDLTDPDGIVPDSGQWTANRTLYLSDADLRRTSSGAAWLTKYQEAVTDWGTISAAANFSTAFETTGDVQITLSNAAIQTQEPGSSISGVTALSPEPIAEEIRLLELARLYNWEGAAVRIKVLTLGSYTTDQANADVEYQLTTIFTGEIAEVDATHDALVLDITQADNAQRSTLPGREADAEEEGDRGVRVPVVYGAFGVPDAFINGLAQYEAVAVGVKPALTPMVQDGRSGFDRYFAWADWAGRNLGYTNQVDFGTTLQAPSEDSYIVRYHPDTEAFSTMVQVSSAPTNGEWLWIDGAASNDDGRVYFKSFPTAYCYLPANYVAGSTGLTNGANATDRNASTYATLDVGTGATAAGNYVHFKLPEVAGGYGELLAEDNAIQAYVVVSGNSVNASVNVKIGLWRVAGGGSYVGSTSRTLTGTNFGSSGILFQTSMPISNFYRVGYDEPPTRWEWKYTDGSGSAAADDMYVRLEVSADGAASDEVHIIAAGLRYKYAIARNTSGGKRVQVSGDPFNPTITVTPITKGLGGFKPERSIQVVDSGYWGLCENSSLDNGAGSVTGSAESNIEHPIDIAHHILRKWCQDTSPTDIETSTSTFGTFASTARTRLDKWIGSNVAGGSSNTWKCAWTIAQDTTVASALSQLCSEAPMLIQRDPATGKFLCVVYENESLGIGAQDWEKFLDSDDNAVTFHPNYFDERGAQSDAGRPYAVQQFGARSGGRESRYTDVRVRFRRFAPTGAYLDTVYANPDGQKVWSVTAGDYVEGASGTLYTQCGAAESYLRRRTEEFVLESVTIQDPATATGLLWYLTTVLTGQPVKVRGYTNAEGCVLKPGHAFQISDDMNLWNPAPLYGGNDWENLWFYCTRVDTSFNGREPVVYFEGVQWLVI